MRIVEMNANAWSQKSLYIITTLSDEQIITVLRPIIDIKRDEGESFNNDILIEMLQFRYPMEYVKLINKIDKLIF